MFFGWSLFKRTLKKYVFYKNLKSFLELLQTEVGFFQNDVDAVLDKLNYSVDFQNLISNYKQNKNLDDWKPKILSFNETEDIKIFFSKFGRVDVESQLSDVKAFLNVANQKLLDIKQEDLKKAKMSFLLSVMLGLLFVVLLL